MVNKETIVVLLEERGYGRFEKKSWLIGHAQLISICGIEVNLTEAKMQDMDESDNWNVQLNYEVMKRVFVLSDFDIVKDGVFQREEFIEWEAKIRAIHYKIAKPWTNERLVFVGPKMTPFIVYNKETKNVHSVHPITDLCNQLVEHFGSWLKLLRLDLDQLEQLVKALKVAKVKFKDIVEDLTND